MAKKNAATQNELLRIKPEQFECPGRRELVQWMADNLQKGREQMDMHGRTGITIGTINHIVHGRRRPSIDHAISFKEICGIEVEAWELEWEVPWEWNGNRDKKGKKIYVQGKKKSYTRKRRPRSKPRAKNTTADAAA